MKDGELMGYVVGIDGGGTKTIAAIASEDGKILAKAAAGPVNPNVVQKQELFQTLSWLMQDLAKQSGIGLEQITSLFAGISGAGNDRAVRMLTKLLHQLVHRDSKVKVEPDTVNALYSGTYGGPGIVQISGTGSITFGINDEGKRDRTGGWGYLFGDEGSGYDIGREGMITALKAFDGRGRDTMLLDMVRDHFQIKSPYDLIQHIYASRSPKGEISPVTRLVFSAYKHGDQAATDILTKAVQEMSCSIRTLKFKLFSPEQSVSTILCGGVFTDKEILPALLQAELRDDGQLRIITPEMNPAGGSIIGAFLMENRKPDESIIQQIISTC